MNNSLKILIAVIITLTISVLINITNTNRIKKDYQEIIILSYQNGYLKGALNYKYYGYNKFNERLINSTKGFCKILNIDTLLVDKLNNK